MLKQLTLAAFAAALLPACILTTDNTTVDPTSDSDSASTGTEGGTTTESGTTTEGGTTTESGSTTDTPTTDNSSTDAPTTDATTTVGTSTTDDTTTDATTGQSGFGKCGWAEAGFYACEEDGGAAGVEDPDAVSPIECGEGIVGGEKCDGTSPVSTVGCCTPEGTLYFCDTETDPNAPVIFQQECGA